MLERTLVESGSVCEREDVPAERTLHERHVLTRHERHEAVVLRVDALKGSRDFLSFFYLGYV